MSFLERVRARHDALLEDEQIRRGTPAYIVGRHLAREYWRGFRWGAGVACALTIAACVAEAIR